VINHKGHKDLHKGYKSKEPSSLLFVVFVAFVPLWLKTGENNKKTVIKEKIITFGA